MNTTIHTKAELIDFADTIKGTKTHITGITLTGYRKQDGEPKNYNLIPLSYGMLIALILSRPASDYVHEFGKHHWPYTEIQVHEQLAKIQAGQDAFKASPPVKEKPLTNLGANTYLIPDTDVLVLKEVVSVPASLKDVPKLLPAMQIVASGGAYATFKLIDDHSFVSIEYELEAVSEVPVEEQVEEKVAA